MGPKRDEPTCKALKLNDTVTSPFESVHSSLTLVYLAQSRSWHGHYSGCGSNERMISQQVFETKEKAIHGL